MLFNSIEFLLFFPIITIIYFLFPNKYRWALLLSASFFFYMFFIPLYVLILVFTILIDYIAGILIDQATAKKKMWLVISICANVGVLMVFKYYNFFNENLTVLLHGLNWKNPIPYLNIILPIGLSFHTFQAMSYTIEVYKGKQKAERHLGIYALYVMYYPQLVAGPIERPQNILPQLHLYHKFDYDRVSSGLKQMLWGVFKKVVIADRLTQFVDIVYANPGSYHGFPLIWATLFFAIQIYCDFSGYSDIALGASRVMGIELMQNFNMPYLSKSISEFWGRWHISLSTWFRDYLYIPLGGNRVKKNRWFFNLFFVFFVSGFWHGASWNYIIWGVLHGVYLIFGVIKNELFKTKSIFNNSLLFRPIINTGNWLITFTLVCIAWIFFRAKTTQDAFIVLSNISHIDTSNLIGVPNFSKATILLMFFFVFFIFFSDYILEVVKQPFLIQSKKKWLNYSIVFTFVILILLLGVFSNQNFIYFQF
jgi:alginate O-acetyltransferase complex protein AlgI